MRSLDRLQAWIERARENGFVAIDTQTTSPDPMQAELCGFALAVGPNEACYVPLGHRQGGEGGNGTLFRGDVVPDQIPEGDALEALKPLLTDPGVLKIGEDFKFDWQVFARRGIEIAPYDDTQLMSYVVDAGRADHGLGGLAQSYFDHAAIDLNEVIKTGKTKSHLRLRRRRPRHRIRRRGGRRRVAALARAQAAACRRACAQRL